MAGDTPDQGEGRVINGRYRLLRSLGAGGMGRVWLAYDEELACEVAMKEIALPDVPMDATEPAQRIARARSEARHAARLRGHPHVATVHDVVVHEGLPWIVMEYVPDAVDLQAVVRSSGPLLPAQAARIGLAVLDALTAGHRIGILHRDVKPANILLASDASGDPYARVLLTDYGIALQPESREPRLTATAGILGTPGYLAPERARGEPPTPAADLFSLGATLYSAVEGRGPFDRHGDYATLTALLGEEPTPAVRAGELAPVLQGLLVKDPVRRSSPETVARGLERVVQGASPAWPAPAGAAPGGFGPPPEGFGAMTPRTPGAPPTPSTPQTPHTPGGVPQGVGGAVGAVTPGSGGPGGGGFGPGGPATPAGAPPSQYDPWRQASVSQQSPEAGNPYAQGPYASGGAQSPSAGSGGPAPYGPYTGGGSTPYGGPAPYEGGPTPPYAGGTYGAGWGAGGPGAPGGGPPPPPSPSRKRLAVVALVVAAVLVIAGGTWLAVSLTGDDGGDDTATPKKPPTSSVPKSSAPPTGPVLPYGDVVGLSQPLETGDCVQAVWSGTPFKSVPNLGKVSCTEDWPDGQVVAVDTATDAADAAAEGAERCANQTRAVVDALPDAAGYAVVPTKEGFTVANSGTACLVLGRHAAIGGEVGRFRDEGANLWVGQMSVGDCWIYEEGDDGYNAPLTDCVKPHTDQVIGVVQAPDGMNYEKGADNASKLCGNKFESTWAPGSERAVFGWVADEDDWNQGFKRAVCTVGRTDNGKTTGKIPAPGSV
ncbi:serine/threonine-protein kinase [Streptomyces sp. NBC_00140]|uniref:serine/threonine-protein kinase n=1 Tax=Streptomyces sp. NBC_00140 TaxID=2975664 RepID=UPI00225458C3|nr:serine/threonine-protein kinase [Streptomyces sp. NBC_00140]MCX5332490.1 protein kinase [Streptomyces sp. NBC_00140]